MENSSSPSLESKTINIFVKFCGNSSRYIRSYYRSTDDLRYYVDKYIQDHIKTFGREPGHIEYVLVCSERIDPYASNYVIPKEANHICICINDIELI